MLEWDFLLALPLPWWGPVLAPVLIASLLSAGGMNRRILACVSRLKALLVALLIA